MDKEHGAVCCSVVFLLIILLTPLLIRSMNSKSMLSHSDPDLYASFPLHRMQTPVIDELSEYIHSQGLNKVELRNIRQNQLASSHQSASSSGERQSSSSTKVPCYYAVPAQHKGFFPEKDKEKALQQKSVSQKPVSQKSVLQKVECQTSIKHAEFIQKLERSLRAMQFGHGTNAVIVEPEASAHRQLLYAFFVMCCITILLTCSS